MPEMKNIIPAAIVIQVIVSSLYLTNNIPITIATTERMIELWINLIFLCFIGIKNLFGERKASQIVCTQLLRERDWGSFTGRYIPELANLNNPSEWPDDIETLDELKQRAKHFLDWIKSEYPDKVILAVGHGIINKAIQSVFYDKPMNEIAVMKNADIRILQLI